MTKSQNIIMETYREKGVRFAWADKFFHSAFYIALITLIGIAGFFFRYEMHAIYAIAVVSAVGWLFCRDLSPNFLAMAVISLIPLRRYGEVGYFSNAYYVAIFLIAAYIIRLFIHTPKKIRAGRFFVPTLAVAIAVTLGGLFYDRLEATFKMPALYYVLGLGFGMLLINVILESNIPLGYKGGAEFFAKMAVGVGIMGIAMIVINYYDNFSLLAESPAKFFHKFQFGNNLSNMLLITMPMAFYMSTKARRIGFVYFTLGVLEYFTLVFSLSRGGILFGTIVFPFTAVAAIVLAKKWNRPLYIIILIALLAAAVYALNTALAPVLERLGNTLKVSGDEARVNLYKLAIENFKNNLVFGTGLGYVGGRYYFPQPFCIYWYHSTVFQILGSLGLVGVAAYLIQAGYRAFALLQRKTKFNLFVFFVIMGFGGYSLVNVGYFVPFPCMAILIHLFILVDRNNRAVQNGSAADELFPQPKYIDIVE